MKAPRNIKEVRLWHWLRVVKHRAAAREYGDQVLRWEREHAPLKARHARSRMNQYNSIADWHLSAVQALNDFLPDTTAEQDAANSEFHNRAPRRGE